MEVFEDAPADLDTPVAGEEIENGAEVPQNEGPDETGNELQPGDEITDPDPVEIPEEEMQVGDIQDESQDESQDEAMPEDPELSYQEYDFSAKRLEEYLLSAKPQDKIIQESQGGNFISNMDHTTFQSLYSLNSMSELDKRVKLLFAIRNM
jgi:hypothetical protein